MSPSSGSTYVPDLVASPIPYRSGSPGIVLVTDSPTPPSTTVQRAASMRPADSVPQHLAGSYNNIRGMDPNVPQQLPINLSKSSLPMETWSKKFRASSK